MIMRTSNFWLFQQGVRYKALALHSGSAVSYISPVLSASLFPKNRGVFEAIRTEQPHRCLVDTDVGECLLYRLLFDVGSVNTLPSDSYLVAETIILPAPLTLVVETHWLFSVTQHHLRNDGPHLKNENRDTKRSFCPYRKIKDKLPAVTWFLSGLWKNLHSSQDRSWTGKIHQP